jgi:hypothetical protein
MEKLNQWLTLAANLGVLVGLMFLVVELNQANRIAAYTAENARRTQFLDMNTSRIENPEIIAKLMQPNPGFSDIEWVQALYTARQQTNTWVDAEHAMRYGLLSDETYAEIFSDIDTVVDEMPGLTTAFDYLFTAYDVDETTELATMRYLLRAIRAKQEATSSLEVR